MNEPEQPQRNPGSSSKRWLKRAFHGLILVLTLTFVGKNLSGAFDELRSRPLEIHAGWAAAAFGLYAMGLTILGLPMWLVLRDNNEPVTLRQSTRAYLISHIGKYVPGKAMAIVIRCAFLQPLGLSIGRVTLTSFYETFAAMASGSLIAICGLLLSPSPTEYAAAVAVEPWVLWMGIACVSVGFVGAVTPPGFRLFTQIATMPFKSAQGYTQERIGTPTFAGALFWGMVAWLVMGASYTATIAAVGQVTVSTELWIMSTACLAMSIIGGFLSMIPGQAVVREAILIQTLTPLVGQLTAVVASLAYRCVTLLTELVLATALYLGGKR